MNAIDAFRNRLGAPIARARAILAEAAYRAGGGPRPAPQVELEADGFAAGLEASEMEDDLDEEEDDE